MKIAKTGVTRTVFIFKNFVVKIPNTRHSWHNFICGINANINENNSWKYNSFYPEKISLLCPIIWASWGGWIVIMKRAEVCPNETDINYDIWQRNGFWDNKPENFGWYKGKLVKIDYA
jgi:hypothetical protein